MNYEQTEAKRLELITELEEAELALYKLRRQWLPSKDSGQFSSELARKTEMEGRTAAEQSRVDALKLTIEAFADRAKYLTGKSNAKL